MAIPLVVLALLFGILPGLVLQYMDATIDKQAQDITNVVQTIVEERLEKAAAEEDEDTAADEAATAKASDDASGDVVVVPVAPVPSPVNQLARTY